MSISGSNSDVNVANMDEQKREPILTAKALINKMEKLHKERQAKVHKMKSVIKTMKDLMQRDDNASQIRTQLEHLMQLVKETTLLHTSVIPLLPTDEQEKQNVWFAKTLEYNNGFIDDVKQWLSETGRQPSSTIAHVPSIEISDEHQQSESYVSKQSEKNVETSEAQDEIKPSDSVSNVGSIRSGKRSSAGIRSSVSITSSCIRAEADMAALMARQMLLKDKHALDEQEEELRNTKEELRKKEEQLRKKREQLEMEVEIAASRAKMNVLRRSGRSRAASNTSVSPNGMNSYLERGRKEATLSAGAKTFVPGTNRPTGGGQQLQSDGQFLHGEPEAKYGHLQHQATRSSEANIHHSSTQLHPQLQQQSNHPAALAPSSSAQNSLMNVLERQNEITAMLVQQQSLSFLPKREIQIFDGSPFQYQAFIRAFEHCIEEKTNNPKDCLYFLEQYTRGQPLELVRSCQHMAHDRGYAKAKALLQEHFGNAQKIVSAYMEKALSWQPIKVEDVRALQAYGLFLRGCCNVMEDFEYMCELNMPSNMLAIIKKLPYKYRDKWRTLAYDLQKRQGQRATFLDIVSFIERQVEIVSDPLFGDIQDTPPAANKDVRKATF